MKKPRGVARLLEVMARLRAPGGCPWDQAQTHASIRLHAIEEVYELIDAIEAGDDPEMAEELGDLLLQVVFHCQLAQERGAFDFERVTARLVAKLIRRHPHVFGESSAKSIDAVWAQWDQIKHAEKKGTRHERPSALDGVPKHLPALMRAEKLAKKARKAGLWNGAASLPEASRKSSGPAAMPKRALAENLFDLAAAAQAKGWSAESLLREESRRRERQWRAQEKKTKR